ncbi:cupin domain-containing protein [Pseudoroseicyclus tamaricis]|uniref:Cupin domain-containing protein n=1 Tax=Pseudoroseicyclus tamaricis TaxID=2705421 RepID=A0A6B2JZG4_9RHOB|nr:cupin domain-containing protein [Pseudoroseicyclus tamaricis]NDV02039.1 cupin domain-containing protein [Pseudoroseicyclus tamaricis]
MTTAPRPRRYETLGILMTFHAFPDEVMGKFCLIEAVVPPGLGAPPNTHAGETESFVVLEGEVDFMIEGEVTRAGAGESVIIPDGAAHAFSAVGESPARLMILNAPGQMHERFFTELGVPVTDDRQEPAPMDGPPDVARVVAVAQEAGMTILVPAEA